MNQTGCGLSHSCFFLSSFVISFYVIKRNGEKITISVVYYRLLSFNCFFETFQQASNGLTTFFQFPIRTEKKKNFLRNYRNFEISFFFSFSFLANHFLSRKIKTHGRCVLCNEKGIVMHVYKRYRNRAKPPVHRSVDCRDLPALVNKLFFFPPRISHHGWKECVVALSGIIISSLPYVVFHIFILFLRLDCRWEQQIFILSFFFLLLLFSLSIFHAIAFIK